MSIAAAAVRRRTVTRFTTWLLMAAGVAAFFSLGQLEDPEFTIKTAVVYTSYPGASPEEVELEVTDRIELAIQEMPQIKEIESFSRVGESLITVDILARYRSDELPQIWDELRKKIGDIEHLLPPGAGPPQVSDDFGDVYGFLLAVVADGFTYAELESRVDELRKELSLVDGVARVELWGIQPQCVYLDVSEAQLSQMEISYTDLARTLTEQNTVVDGGSIDISPERLRFQTTGEFDSPEDIGDLVIRGQSMEPSGRNTKLLRIRDIATVRRGYIEPAPSMMRYDGQSSVAIAISNVAGGNVVDLGRALDARLDELMPRLPVGIEVKKIAWQGDIVDESIKAFMVSLMQAVGIVLVVLLVAMGLRVAIIVGLTGLVFTIVGGFVIMAIGDVDLQRMSLGALIIAMGMMVDNAIVVADGILVRLQQGMDRTKAAIEAASQPAMPLLGATVIAVAAFYPIAASEENAGEYCKTLFSVVAIALLLSWVLSVTIAPVLCMDWLPAPKGDAGDAYGGALYRMFRGVLGWSIRFRWIMLVGLVALLGLAGYGFRYVPQLFFPASDRPQFMLDVWAPEGTRIQEVADGLRLLEDKLMDMEAVQCVSAFIGQGPPRFYLPVDPESPYQSYGQLIVNTNTGRDVERVIAELQPWLRNNVPGALTVCRKYGLGPSETWQVEARFSGPAVADPAILRDLAAQAAELVRASPHTNVVRTNWRQRTKKIVADYDEANARWTSITRSEIANATRRAYDGLPVGLYREDDKLLPILIRDAEADRRLAASRLDALQVRPAFLRQSIPLAQVTTSIDVEWEDPMIWRMDRRRAITVQAVPVGLANDLRDDVKDAIEAIELPPGYDLTWDGEYRSSRDAKASLVPGVLPAVALMALIIIGLFNEYRPALIIACVIPFAMIGVSFGLLVTRQPFGFVALLGAMSLSGMMVKNAIVLLDQVNIELEQGADRYDAIINAAVSRLRPVVLAAATTVLGVIPLLPDVFWKSLAVTIMFGLAFGTLLTMIAIPVLYACFYRLPSRPIAAS